MTLSWSLRLLCLLLIAAGALLAVLQLVLARSAPAILRRLAGMAARRRERVLYWLQMGPLLAALFTAGALCIPGYLRFETNHAREFVSGVCPLAAALIALWFAFALFRGARIALRSARYARACRRAGRLLPLSPAPPVLAVSHPAHPVALHGLRQPVIIVSAEWLSSGVLQHDTLAVALEHERSHARHRDNWKLLSLSFLPRIPGRDPWKQDWQTAADWAADDDAVSGDPDRSLLLAEALVLAARSVRPTAARIACTALTSAEAGLAARIDRLVHPRPTHALRPSRLPALAAVLLLATLAVLAASPWIYSLSESLLHLGRL